MTIKHALRIPPGKLRYYQERYDFSAEANLDKYQQLGPQQGYLTRKQLHENVSVEVEAPRRPRTFDQQIIGSLERSSLDPGLRRGDESILKTC